MFQNDSITSIYYKYFVKTSFSYNPGCASTDSIILRVYPNPAVQFITPEICLTDAIAQFYDSTYTGDSTTLPFSYNWNFGDQNASPGNPNSSSVQNPTHHYSAASNYNLTLAVTNIEGCTASASKIFTVNGAVPLAAFSVNKLPVMCSNEPISITNESSVDFGSITKLQIYWGDSAAVSYTDEQPFPGKVYSHSYPNPVSAIPANYTVRMISSSGITCENELDQLISIQPSPHTQFNAVPSFCDYDSPVVIMQATELTGLPGSFSFSESDLAGWCIQSPTGGTGRTYPLLYEYISTNGCIDTAYQTITVYCST